MTNTNYGQPGSNVLNSTLEFSPSNCVPLNNGQNLWNMALFVGANIFAHAATIYPRTGATKTNSFLRMMYMLVAPITAGTVATNAILTFFLGVYKRRVKWTSFFSSREELSEAVPAGGVGILIPRDLAPVLAGRWKLVGDARHSLMLNHSKTHPRHSKEPHIPSHDSLLEFILPPQSKLPGYEGYKFYPSSGAGSELVAVAQLIYGVYQLVSDYGSEIQLMGLSSPYVCVIPYLVMSLVNLVANLLMPSYTHIVIIPPDEKAKEESDRASRTSSITIKASSESLKDDAITKIEEEAKSQTDTEKSAATETTVDLEEGKKGDEITILRKKPCRCCARVNNYREAKWDKHYMSLYDISKKGPRPPKDNVPHYLRKKLSYQRNPDMAFITWTTIRSYWGKGEGFRFSSSWSRDCHPTRQQEELLETWLREHYPGIETNIHERPLKIHQLSRYISVIFTLVVTTLLLGVLTRFTVMVNLYAGKFLALVYVPPTVLLLPFILLQFNRTSLKFYIWVDLFSGLANQLIISAWTGAIVFLGISVWKIGNCTVWQDADNQTWLAS